MQPSAPVLFYLLAGHAMAVAQPTLPTAAAGPSLCSHATESPADGAAAELCAGEEVVRLATTIGPGPERSRQLTRAADHYRRASSLARDVKLQVLALTRLADCYDATQLDDPSQMEAALREHIRILPTDFSPVSRLVQLLETRGFLDAAESTLLETRQRQPDAIEPLKLLARFYARRVTALSKEAARANPPTSGPGEPDASGVYRVGGSLSAPTRLDVPQYPPDAKAAGLKGAVLVDVVIDTTGRVIDATVVQSIPLLDEAALKAVRAWQFEPAVLNGRAVPVRMVVTVNFTLPPESAGPGPVPPK